MAIDGNLGSDQRPPGTAIDADDYFSGMGWRVAYGFLTEANQWTKQLPRSGGMVETGAGYWVWISRGEVLRPDFIFVPYCPWDYAG